MSSAPKTNPPKPSANEDGSAKPDKASGNDELSESELKALHEGLDALRAETEAAEAARIEEKESRPIYVLIAWAACDFGVSQDVICAMIERHFEMSDIRELQGQELQDKHYDELVKFLKNLDLKDVRQFLN